MELFDRSIIGVGGWGWGGCMESWVSVLVDVCMLVLEHLIDSKLILFFDVLHGRRVLFTKFQVLAELFVCLFAFILLCFVLLFCWSVLFYFNALVTVWRSRLCRILWTFFFSFFFFHHVEVFCCMFRNTVVQPESGQIVNADLIMSF